MTAHTGRHIVDMFPSPLAQLLSVMCVCNKGRAVADPPPVLKLNPRYCCLLRPSRNRTKTALSQTNCKYEPMMFSDLENGLAPKSTKTFSGTASEVALLRYAEHLVSVAFVRDCYKVRLTTRLFRFIIDHLCLL